MTNPILHIYIYMYMNTDIWMDMAMHIPNICVSLRLEKNMEEYILDYSYGLLGVEWE